MPTPGASGDVTPGHAVAIRVTLSHKIDIADAPASALDRTIGILGHALHKRFHFRRPVNNNGLGRADCHAFEAADTSRRFHMAFMVAHAQGLLRP